MSTWRTGRVCWNEYFLLKSSWGGNQMKSSLARNVGTQKQPKIGGTFVTPGCYPIRKWTMPIVTRFPPPDQLWNTGLTQVSFYKKKKKSTRKMENCKFEKNFSFFVDRKMTHSMTSNDNQQNSAKMYQHRIVLCFEIQKWTWNKAIRNMEHFYFFRVNWLTLKFW